MPSIQVVDFVEDPDPAAVLRFLSAHVTGNDQLAREHVADHSEGLGTTLTARHDQTVTGLVTVRWRPRDPGLAADDIPLVHQLVVSSDHRRRGIADRLMAGAEARAQDRGHHGIAVTVGLFDTYGPAQRLYASRGYLPDGRGACRGRVPTHLGETVVLDHSLLIWLVKPL